MNNLKLFKDFLKKFTIVNNNFINDFFSVYINNNINYTAHECTIDLEIVCDWLESPKANIKRTLTRSYINKIDYVIKQSTPNKPGKPPEKILITPDCFKMLCMQSRTKKGKEVRLYFVEIEKALDKYKDHIVLSMKNKIKQLENNQKPYVNPQKGIIYVFEALNSDMTLYKIGRTKNLINRMKKHNSSSANDIKILFQSEVSNLEQVESCVKNALKNKQYRKYKEIYEVNLNVIKTIINDCDYFVDSMNKKINGGKVFFAIVDK